MEMHTFAMFKYLNMRLYLLSCLLPALLLTVSSCSRPERNGTLATTTASDTGHSGYVHLSDSAFLYYDCHGNGQPLILLHGHSLDHRMWDEQLPALSEYFRVYRVDLRGYGLSSQQVEGQPFVHADDVIALMDSLGIRQTHVVGLSMGAFIAGDLVAMYPDRLLSCTLASGGIRSVKGPSEPMDSLESAQRDREIAALKAKGVDVYKKEWIEALISSGGTDRERMRAPLTQMVNDWSAWQPLHKEARCYYAREAWDSLKVRRPAVPTLFLKGERDGGGKSSMMQYLPNSRQVVLPNCGHMMNMDQPEAFNRALLDFLLPLREK